MAQSIPSMPIPPHPRPPTGICQAFVILSDLAAGNLLENLCMGWGIFQLFQKCLILFLLQYFTKKYAYLDKQDNTLLVYSLSKDFSGLRVMFNSGWITSSKPHTRTGKEDMMHIKNIIEMQYNDCIQFPRKAKLRVVCNY